MTKKKGKKGERRESRIKVPLKVPLVDKDWRGGTFAFVPIFDHMVSMFVGGRVNALKYFEKHSGKSDDLSRMLSSIRDSCPPCGCAGETVSFGAASLIIVRDLDLSDIKSVTTIFHEATHVAMAIARRTGVEIGEDGEIVAYLAGFIVEKLLENIKKGMYGTLGDDGLPHSNVPALTEEAFQ